METIQFGFKTCSTESVSKERKYEHGWYEASAAHLIRKVLLPEIQDRRRKLKRIFPKIHDRQIKETYYYISDEESVTAPYFNATIRGHWILKIVCAGSGCCLQGKCLPDEPVMRRKTSLL
ncbi:MAG: hypothetical protein LBH92_03880 [Bacteroidales bacterium]|jgi:hypothetical protein|nr:hypothetical protein [Bacteroidales bacterium]